jgi:predicted tellurium resistance membrane protein TerC
MAVVFISPKQRQKMFLVGIATVFLLFLIVVSFGVFLSKPKEIQTPLVFNKPKINIDMKVFDSEQFKNLQPLQNIEMQFSYKGLKDKKSLTGIISAASLEQARKILEDMGLTVTELKEIEIGRENPFTPY